MAEVTVRYWAAAKEAAGVAEETVKAESLSDILDTILSARPGDSRFAAVISRSSFLIDDEPVGKRDPASISLRDGSAIEVLPAFAGG